jgi:hypothetical protein
VDEGEIVHGEHRNDENPVADAIDGARPDWRVSPDAMRWSPDGYAEEQERASVAALIEQHRAAALGRELEHDEAFEPLPGPRAPERVGPLAAGVVRELTAGARLALPPGRDDD